MKLISKLLQRRAAATGATLNRIYDVYMKPDGRVEGEGEEIVETLERGNETPRRAAITMQVPKN